MAQVMADAERLSAEDEPYHREPITYEAPYLDNLPTACLLYTSQYLTDAEKAPYQAWAAEQQAARAANDAALDLSLIHI